MSRAYSIKTKTGDVTIFGFMRGYIQASPNPKVKAYLDYQAENIILRKQNGDITFPIKQLKIARKLLKELKEL